MALFVGIGFALRHFSGWDAAIPVALIASVLIAPLVPAKAACGVRLPTAERDPAAGPRD